MEIGTDLTKLSEEEIRDFLEKNRDKAENSRYLSIIWHTVSAYLMQLDLIRELEKRQNIKRKITKAIIGQEFEFETEKTE